MAGSLYLIGTPIGNLSDMSPRCVETLRRLDLLYCEDTRVTGKLVTLAGARPALRRLSDDMQQDAWTAAVAEVQAGKTVGYATDAGMPGIADPARRLTRAAWAAGIVPVVVPGPSAVSALLAAAPFVANSYRFAGFAPRKAGEREGFVAELQAADDPCVFFDAPSRVHATLDALCSALEPGRELLIGREMTKLHEQLLLVTAGEWGNVRDSVPARGEFAVAVAARPVEQLDLNIVRMQAALGRLEQAGFSRRDAVRALAACEDLPANALKKLGYGS